MDAMALARKENRDKDHLKVFKGTTVLRWAEDKSSLIWSLFRNDKLVISLKVLVC